MQAEKNMLPTLCSAKRCNKNPLMLQWFAEGGTGAADGSTGESGMGRDAAAPGQQNTPGATQTDGADKTAAFEKLIRGEYKEQFAARTQRIIDQRFRESRAERELVNTLANHYGLEQGDYQGITKAATQNSAADAQQRQQKAQSLLERYRNSRVERICADWQEEGRALQQQYPGFAWEQELSDQAFAGMLRAGVPLRTAYEARHLEELLGGAMQYAADKAAEAAEMRAAARAQRPAENGLTPRSSSVMQPDVNALTLAQREQIERRVAKGERIRF